MTLSRIPSSKRGVRSYSQALNCPSRRGARLRDIPQRCHRRSAAPSPQYSYAYITGLPPPPRSAAGLYDKLLRSAIISYASIVLALALPKLFLASQAQLKQVQSCRSERDREDHGAHCTEVRFASFLSDRFITAIVVNPPERNLAKRTSVQCLTLVIFVSA